MNDVMEEAPMLELDGEGPALSVERAERLLPVLVVQLDEAEVFRLYSILTEGPAHWPARLTQVRQENAEVLTQILTILTATHRKFEHRDTPRFYQLFFVLNRHVRVCISNHIARYTDWPQR